MILFMIFTFSVRSATAPAEADTSGDWGKGDAAVVEVNTNWAGFTSTPCATADALTATTSCFCGVGFS